MTWDTIEEKWQELKGRARAKWAALTDDDIETISGKRAALCGKIQERYGITQELAEIELDAFESEVRNKGA